MREDEKALENIERLRSEIYAELYAPKTNILTVLRLLSEVLSQKMYVNEEAIDLASITVDHLVDFIERELGEEVEE